MIQMSKSTYNLFPGSMIGLFDENGNRIGSWFYDGTILLYRYDDEYNTKTWFREELE